MLLLLLSALALRPRQFSTNLKLICAYCRLLETLISEQQQLLEVQVEAAFALLLLLLLLLIVSMELYHRFPTLSKTHLVSLAWPL